MAVLPSGESVRPADEILSGLVLRIPERMDEEQVPRVEDVLGEPEQTGDDRELLEAIAGELLAGKLTLQAIADAHYLALEEIVRIRDAALAILGPGDPIPLAIIRERLTGAAAAKRFDKHPPDISRRITRSAKVLIKCIYERTFFERGFMPAKKKTIRMQLDENLAADLKAIAGRVKLSVPETLSRMAIRWIAEREVRRKSGPPELLFEFVPGADARQIYQTIAERLEWERRSRWEAEAHVKAARGEPLTVEEAAYAKRKGEAQGLMITSYLQVEELKRTGELPSNLPATVDYDGVLSWYVKMQAGEITRERFDAVLADYSRPIPNVPDAFDEAGD